MRVLPLSTAGWQFREARRGAKWRAAAVPGCVHRDLLAHGLIPDPFWAGNESAVQWIEERDWEYRLAFDVPASFLERAAVELVADGLDTVAFVHLNGREVGRGDNMFVRHRWNVKSLLRSGRNVLDIRFGSARDYLLSHRKEHQPREINDPVGRCTVMRKQQCQFGWDWGPRLVTAGIWRDLSIEAWNGNRLDDVRITQEHLPGGEVVLNLHPELARAESSAITRWHLSIGAITVAEGTGPRITVEHPQLWWPNGQGAQPLYRLDVEVTSHNGALIGRWARRIGLRTVVLDRHPDTWGESFQFVVNGRPVFAKGANWVPAHCFVAGLKREDYERDLRSAAQAHMNMLRAWGGGIYESEHFYDICDELGLLVWQDFMFACTRYPADPAFVASVRTEAQHQVARLRHHACLALWCGNNEVFGCNAEEIRTDRAKLAAYETLFHKTLPGVVAAVDGVTAYWPGSPWRGDLDTSHAAGEARGDTHFWDVWHGRHPMKDYEKHAFRFVSEFGMQSFCSPATQATFCPPDDDNVFGPSMKHHQKNPGGNQVILDYLFRRYRFPKGQEGLIYLSQLNQADCMQMGVEHWRRNSPRCMGALYWQLNDCWPVASWSSIEFTGRWKALHHIARRFFAPTLVSAHVPGDETEKTGNRRCSTVREVHLHTVYDAPTPAKGLLRWSLCHFDGRRLRQGQLAVALRPRESRLQKTLDLAKPLALHGRDSLYLRIALEVAGNVVSENSVFLTPPRYLALPRARTSATVRMGDPRHALITFSSPVFQHRFTFDLAGLAHDDSDNFFDLHPGEPRTVTVALARPLPADRVRRLLTWHSLVDTY